MANQGSRVGAILSANDEVVNLLGYGVYSGDEIPPDGFLNEAGATNPKITLDNGDVVWGYQCWWGPEDEVKNSIAGRKIINAKVTD